MIVQHNFVTRPVMKLSWKRGCRRRLTFYACVQLLYRGSFMVQRNLFFHVLVGYVEERLWWPIRRPNKERKKKASS